MARIIDRPEQFQSVHSNSSDVLHRFLTSFPSRWTRTVQRELFPTGSSLNRNLIHRAITISPCTFRCRMSTGSNCVTVNRVSYRGCNSPFEVAVCIESDCRNKYARLASSCIRGGKRWIRANLRIGCTSTVPRVYER